MPTKSKVPLNSERMRMSISESRLSGSSDMMMMSFYCSYRNKNERRSVASPAGKPLVKLIGGLKITSCDTSALRMAIIP
jgi:hypothetical protein